MSKWTQKQNSDTIASSSNTKCNFGQCENCLLFLFQDEYCKRHYKEEKQLILPATLCRTPGAQREQTTHRFQDSVQQQCDRMSPCGTRSVQHHAQDDDGH